MSQLVGSASPSSTTVEHSSSAAMAEKSQPKSQAGASWKANEQHVLPKNNLPVVFTGIALAVFLAALDQVC